MTKRNALVFTIILLVIAFIFFIFAIFDIGSKANQRMTEKLQETKQIEEFYEPMYLNDSLFHLNISEESCVLIGADTSVILVQANNIEYVNYDKDTHIIEFLCHSSPNILIGDKVFSTTYYKRINLDTILSVHNNQLDNAIIEHN